MTTEELQDLARQIAQEYGLPAEGFLAQVARESGWDPSATGAAGEIGLTQFLPSTAEAQGLDLARLRVDPEYQLRAGAEYLVWIGDWLADHQVPLTWRHILAAYNGGIGQVRHVWETWGEDWQAHLSAGARAYAEALAPIWERDAGEGPGAIVSVGGSGLLLGGLVLLGAWAWRNRRRG